MTLHQYRIGVVCLNQSTLLGAGFLILVLVLSSVNGVNSYDALETVVAREEGYQKVHGNSHTPHVPITINGNADFSSQGWPGNGTQGAPYLIEGLNITADATCIYITNTTAYFEVRDCVISSVSSSSFHGILLVNVTHGTVRNCTVDMHYFGFYLYSLSGCALTNNTATKNHDGFSLSYSESCTLTNNTAFGNLWGIYLYYSNCCILTNNIATGNTEPGFTISLSSNCTLTNNTATSNSLGIFLGPLSEYNMLYLNRLGENIASNARDDGDSNIWDDNESIGNYWSDYSGTGTYQIPGDAGSIDNYPFLWKLATPTSTTSGYVNPVMLLALGAGIVGVPVLVFVFMRQRSCHEQRN